MNKKEAAAVSINPLPNWVLTLLLKSLSVALAIAGLSLCLVVIAHASNEVEMADVKQGQLLFKTDRPGQYQAAPILETEVQIDVTAMVARATLKQRFENPDDVWVEGVYVFPLPENAAVDHMRLIVGERIIEGHIKEREAAKRLYNAAKQQGKKTALIEQERPNLFTTSVANIGPKEVVYIEIEYQQTLRYDAGQFRLRFPMTITPRYIPGEPILTEESVDTFATNGWAMNTTQVADASRITPPYSARKAAISPVRLKVNLNSGFAIDQLHSRYHAVDISQQAPGKASIKLAKTNASKHDFELVWSPKKHNAPKAALFSEKVGDDFYHLLMVMPPALVQGHRQSLPREVVFVIDTSGSMQGSSIRQAKQALLMALNRMQSDDRFNVIEFNSLTRSVFSSSQIASPQNLRQAQHFVSSLQANGGTEIGPALERALTHDKEENSRIRQIVFLTDGSVGNEAQLFSLIEKRLGQSRLFTVGIGSAPNSYFMSKAAQFGRGTFTYIGDVNEVQTKMTALFSKLEAPVMRHLKLNFDDESAEIWPQKIPDLYLGEPLVITAKTKNNHGKVSIQGQRLKQTWQLELPLQGGEEKGVGVLWARNKIASLMDELHSGKAKEAVRQDVIDVALAHHLVSQYTSLIAVDISPTRPIENRLDKRKVPQALPQNQMQTMGRLPQTATPAQLQIILGLVLLLIASVMRKRLC